MIIILQLIAGLMGVGIIACVSKQQTKVKISSAVKNKEFKIKKVKQ